VKGNLKYLFKSFVFFVQSTLIKRHYDVVFLYLNHFNRSEQGTNPYYIPAIEFCKAHNLSYVVFEDTDLKGAYKSQPRDEMAIPFDFITLMHIVLLKLIKFFSKVFLKKSNGIEIKANKIIKFLFFRKFKSTIIINMAGNKLGLLRCVSQGAIYEMQHGIICKEKTGWLANGAVDKTIQEHKIMALVYGIGFKNYLIENDQSRYYNEKNVVALGQSMFTKQISAKTFNKNILVSLQITPDFKDTLFDAYVGFINEIIENNSQFFINNNYTLILRHHPRYHGKIDVIRDKSFIKIDASDNISQAIKQAGLHLTLHSTTSFECALLGVPTLFMEIKGFDSPTQIFINEYKYPVAASVIYSAQDFLNQLQKTIKNYHSNSIAVMNWASLYYQKFNSDKFLDILAHDSSLNSENEN